MRQNLTKLIILLLFSLIANYYLPITKVYALTEKTYYLHQDHLGSVIAVTDETGTLVSQSKYSPYGSTQQTYNSQPTTYNQERGYTNQIKDKNTTLSYYNARYYDPVLSRFISPDSVQGGNRFAYVADNPVMRNDPGGNQGCDPEDYACRHPEYQGADSHAQNLTWFQQAEVNVFSTAANNWYTAGRVAQSLLPAAKTTAIVAGAASAAACPFTGVTCLPAAGFLALGMTDTVVGQQSNINYTSDVANYTAGAYGISVGAKGSYEIGSLVNKRIQQAYWEKQYQAAKTAVGRELPVYEIPKEYPAYAQGWGDTDPTTTGGFISRDPQSGGRFIALDMSRDPQTRLQVLGHEYKGHFLYGDEQELGQSYNIHLDEMNATRTMLNEPWLTAKQRLSEFHWYFQNLLGAQRIFGPMPSELNFTTNFQH